MSDQASAERNLHGITRRDLIKGGLAAGFSIGVAGSTLLGARRTAAQETASRAETDPIDTLIEDYISRTKTPGWRLRFTTPATAQPHKHFAGVMPTLRPSYRLRRTLSLSLLQ
jgi:hypothetical protein